MLLAASDPNTSEDTCEVIFAPQFQPGTILEPEGFSVPEDAAEMCFVKADKFAEMGLCTKDGFVVLDGKKIGADGKFLSVEKYKDGKVK